MFMNDGKDHKFSLGYVELPVSSTSGTFYWVAVYLILELRVEFLARRSRLQGRDFGVKMVFKVLKLEIAKHVSVDQNERKSKH